MLVGPGTAAPSASPHRRASPVPRSTPPGDGCFPALDEATEHLRSSAPRRRAGSTAILVTRPPALAEPGCPGSVELRTTRRLGTVCMPTALLAADPSLAP